MVDTDEALQAVTISPTEPVIIFSRSTGKLGHDPKYIVLSQSVGNLFILDIAKLDPAGVKQLLIQVTNVIGYDVKAS